MIMRGPVSGGGVKYLSDDQGRTLYALSGDTRSAPAARSPAALAPARASMRSRLSRPAPCTRSRASSPTTWPSSSAPTARCKPRTRAPRSTTRRQISSRPAERARAVRRRVGGTSDPPPAFGCAAHLLGVGRPAPGRAAAQGAPTPAEKAAAEALFQQGTELMGQEELQRGVLQVRRPATRSSRGSASSCGSPTATTTRDGAPARGPCSVKPLSSPTRAAKPSASTQQANGRRSSRRGSRSSSSSRPRQVCSRSPGDAQRRRYSGCIRRDGAARGPRRAACRAVARPGTARSLCRVKCRSVRPPSALDVPELTREPVLHEPAAPAPQAAPAKEAKHGTTQRTLGYAVGGLGVLSLVGSGLVAIVPTRSTRIRAAIVSPTSRTPATSKALATRPSPHLRQRRHGLARGGRRADGDRLRAAHHGTERVAGRKSPSRHGFPTRRRVARRDGEPLMASRRLRFCLLGGTGSFLALVACNQVLGIDAGRGGSAPHGRGFGERSRRWHGPRRWRRKGRLERHVGSAGLAVASGGDRPPRDARRLRRTGLRRRRAGLALLRAATGGSGGSNGGSSTTGEHSKGGGGGSSSEGGGAGETTSGPPIHATRTATSWTPSAKARGAVCRSQPM